MLTPEQLADTVAKVVTPMVWAGFADDDAILETAADYHYPDTPSDDDLARLAAALGAVRAEKAAAMRGWPERTDVDRLIDAFDTLEEDGVLALHNAGMTQSDAHGDAGDEWHQAGGPDSGLLGFVFYHGQDVERAMDGGGLHIGFATFAGGADDPMHVVGLAVDALRAEGFEVEAPKTPATRIFVPRIDWKNRGPA